MRSAFVGAVFAIAGLTAVSIFATSLNRLATTPQMYGATFDFKVPTQDPSCANQDHGIAKLAGISSLAAICYENVQLDNHSTTGWGELSLVGATHPEIVSGRAAATSTEVAVGAATLHAVHKQIGDTVEGSTPNGHATYRIVGTVVFPALGDAQPLADGAWFTQSGFDTLLGSSGDPKNSNFSRYLVGSFAPNADRGVLEARISQLDFDPSSGEPSVVTGPRQPVEISRLRQTNWFPGVIAALLALLALAAVGHALVTGTHRRRHELAMLKTLGFERRQVRYAIAWEATALAVGSLVVGIPLGLVAGIAIWRAVANGLGVVPTATLPLLVGALIPIVVLAVNAIAWLPARAAAAMRPAAALRSE